MQGEVAPAHTYYYPDYAINQGSEEEGMDFGRLGRLLWKRKLWLLVAVALGTVAGWAASRLVAPEYLAFTSVAVEDANTGRGGPIQTGEVLPSDGWNTVFQSRAVIGPVVENLGLQVRIHGGAENELFTSFRADDEVIAGEYAVAVGPGGAWSLTSAGESGVLERGERGTEIGSSRGFSWTPDLSSFEAGSEITFNVMTTQAAVGRILNGLTVRNRINSDIITAELIWHDPYEAADILNATTVSFMNLADQLKTQKIREEVDLLENQRDITGSLLDNAEFALQAHRVEAITEPTERSTPSSRPSRPTRSVQNSSRSRSSRSPICRTSCRAARSSISCPCRCCLPPRRTRSFSRRLASCSPRDSTGGRCFPPTPRKSPASSR
jgi:capsular polysaccharide biosynthesis protein